LLNFFSFTLETRKNLIPAPALVADENADNLIGDKDIEGPSVVTDIARIHRYRSRRSSLPLPGRGVDLMRPNGTRGRTLHRSRRKVIAERWCNLGGTMFGKSTSNRH
jgi:hypothetical protein